MHPVTVITALEEYRWADSPFIERIFVETEKCIIVCTVLKLVPVTKEITINFCRTGND